MNSKERFMNRLQGKVVDRAPNCSIIMGFAPQYIGKPLSEYYLDYRVFVESNLIVCRDFGIDVLSAISDPYREAYDFGAEIEFPLNSLPLSKKVFIETKEDVRKLKVFDPYISTRILDRIKAIELYKREAGNEFPIMGWVECPLAEAADLMGVSSIMINLFDEEDMVKEIMDICLEAGIRCAKAQIEAGADIIGMGDAVASLIGPRLYNEFAFEYERKLISAIHEAGAIARLHICGNTTSLLDYVKLTGADIIDLDWMVDFKAACEKFKGFASACGNFDPVAIVKNGTTEIVNKAVWNCLDDGDETTFIMAGCEIPAATPHENLLAISQALKSYPYK